MLMTSSRRATPRLWTCLALVPVLTLASGALAQDKAAPPKDKAADQQILRGPKVTTERVPGVQDGFGDDQGKGDRKSRPTPPLPHEQFMTILHTLEATETPADLRLTETQKDTIQGIDTAFKAEVRKYRDEHQDEMRQLLKEGGPEVRERLRARRPEGATDGQTRPAADDTDKPMEKTGDKPAASQEPSPALREKFQEFRRNAPKPTDAETRMWHELTDPQQKFLTPRLEAARADVAKQFEERAARRQVEQRLKKKEGSADGQGQDGPPALDRLPPRLRERLEQMSPEERQKALERLRNMTPEQRREFIQKRLRDDGSPDADTPDQPKPAPGMDDVKVPKPEAKPPK
jgi:hypothetical protein